LNFLKYIFFVNIFLFFNNGLIAQTVETPLTDYVTVNQASSLPVIHWSVNNSSLLNGYAVKRFIRSYPSVPDNTWHTVQIIDNPNTFNYEDNSINYGQANPNIQPEIYEITAYKINGNDTVFSLPSEKHQTIFLSGNYDYCSNTINLIWNNYIGWGNEFLKYRIYCKENNGSYIKIAEKNYNDTIFIQNNLNYNSNYSYYIKAVRNDGTESLSNLKEIYTQAINFPTFLKIDSVYVLNNTEFNISFSYDLNANIDEFFLFKSNKLNADFIKINTISAVNIYNSDFEFSDKDYNINMISYYYITAIDYCGNIIFKSDTVSNIVLSAKANSETKINFIEWDDMYKDFGYQIFRSQNETQFERITNTENHFYRDNIFSVYENQFITKTFSGRFCYFVQINKNNFFNKSNVSCAEQEETILFPNAFNPKSYIDENRIFKPKAAFISDYYLTIYGSFGDIIFESNNPDYGWDGTLKNGKFAPISSYLYVVKYKNSKGKYVKLKNYVTLVY